MPRRDDYLYTSTFETYAKVVQPTSEDRFVAQASLQPLKSLLPAGTDVDNSDDVLYFAAAGAVGGMVNRNGDAVTAETAVRCYRTALNKFLSTDHDRSAVVGAIINTGITRFGTNEPLSDADAVALQQPFNMVVAGVVWKQIAGQLARYLLKVGDSLDESALSLSWEIAFNTYSIGYGSENLWDATIVTREDPAFEALDKRMRSKGGNGVGPNGDQLFRVIEGDAVILGYSIVERPAAHVKGILPITQSVAQEPCAAVTDTPVSTAEEPATAAAEPLPATVESTASASSLVESFITPAETSVTTNTAHSMKIETVAQLKTLWPELQKAEPTVALAAIENFVAAFEKANDKHLADINAQKSLATDLEQSKAASEAKAKELEAALATVSKQVADLSAAALAAESNTKFQERMASLDETFDLDNEDRELLAPEVRLLADDAAFAAFQKKQSKLMCGKKKGAKPPFAVAAVVETTVTADVVVAAVASIQPIEGQTQIPAGSPSVDTTLEGEMDSAFGGSMKVHGKTVKERKADKAAAAPKE